MEACEALAGEDGLVVDVFSEDGGEENCVWLVRFRCQNAGDRVTGDGNKCGKRGWRTAQFSDFGGGELAGGGGEVDSVGGDGEGYVGARVDEEPGGGAFDGFEDLAGEGGQGGGGEVLFAELDEVDALFGPEGGLADEGGMLLGLVAGEEEAVGDGAAEHAS